MTSLSLIMLPLQLVDHILLASHHRWYVVEAGKPVGVVKTDILYRRGAHVSSMGYGVYGGHFLGALR